MATEYKEHSKDCDGERLSPPQWQPVNQFSRLSMDSGGQSSNHKQLVPQYSRHSKNWYGERPSPPPRQLVTPFNRLPIDSAGPSSNQKQFVARYSRRSKNWGGERPSPPPRQLVPRFKGLPMDTAGPSSNQKQFAPRYNGDARDSERPSPNSREFLPRTNRHFMPRSSTRELHSLQGLSKIEYPDCAITISFAIDLNGVNHFPSSLCLEPITSEPVRAKVKHPLVLVNRLPAKDNEEGERNISRSPWESIAEKVWPDLLSCLENVRNKMKCEALEEVKPTLVARFGKVIFYSKAAGGLDNVIEGQVSETSLSRLRKLFHTSIPTSYMEKIIREVVPKIGVDFEEEKDIYHVRLSDSTVPNSILSCKCSLKEDKKLELYKVKLIHQIRHMVINISCLDKDVDLRLMLRGKRILTALSDDEMQRISYLINSAVLDPDAKGGLRWPQAAYSQSSRYNVVGVWHTISKVYKSASLTLEVRHADRYNFETATADATTEVSLKLKRLISELVVQKLERDSIYTMFKDTIRMIWEHFLCCEHFLK